jgi:ABC-type transporter Mla maintaining outer membrane lipid asymmetry ATPase subunit MlaF
VTSVVVTHDLKAAIKVSQRIAFLSKGKIVAIEEPKKILNSQESLIKEFVSAAML